MPGLRTSRLAEWSQWQEQGAVAGLVAGIALAAFEVGIATVVGGPGAALSPFRLVATLLLGPRALDPGNPLPIALASGSGVHLVLSLFFGMSFGLLTWAAGRAPRGALHRMVFGGVFGLAVWLAMFYVVAPSAGWAGLTGLVHPLVQAFGHVLFFGAPLGLCVGSVAPTASIRAVQTVSGANTATHAE